MIGFDTGFFVELIRGSDEAVQVWKTLVDKEDDGIVSCLTLFELEKLGLKGAIRRVEILLDSIPEVCRIIWLDPENLSLAAKLSHGLGIPTVDSLILSGFLREEGRIIYTTDSHLEKYKGKGVKVRNIRPLKSK
ncbi:MAG: type II toxin-antitoxin system VapC family toxin [Deltaproteobacteria bacterium]|nr:type II toxin-antitoxin system VapC family toxin [Deltaproteobacteria bacterium]